MDTTENLKINGISIDQLLMKEPFKVPLPIPESNFPITTDGSKKTISRKKQQYKVVTQEQFVAEYYPSGHKIFDRPDWRDTTIKRKVGTDPETGQDITRDVDYIMQRRAVPIQQTIVTKRLAALTGYPVNFQDSDPNPTPQKKSLLANFKQTWVDANMENAVYDFFESVLKTGDGAVYMTVIDDEIIYKVFSYLNGDTLLPHYDRYGNMDMFARHYYQSAVNIQNGEEITTEFLDVFDKFTYTTYVSNMGKWEQYGDVVYHNCGFIPVVYQRIEGAVWMMVQDLIDSFELLLSMLAENNVRVAFRMLLIKSDGDVDIESGTAGGTVTIKVSSTDDAKFLERADASTSFELELKTLYDQITRGCGIVNPNDKSQGDQPTGTTKMQYSPEMIVAMRDAKKLDKAVDDLVRMFRYFIGLLPGNKPTDYNSLRVNGKIDVFTVTDETEWNNMIIQLYINGVISRETAAEKSTIAANDELARLDREQKQLKEEEAMALLEQKGFGEGDMGGDGNV